MKRMSEVFNGEPCGFCATMTDEQVRHGQHAINHVDALADALDAVVEMAWLISEDLSDEFSARPEIVVAQKALAAYRGEK